MPTLIQNDTLYIDLHCLAFKLTFKAENKDKKIIKIKVCILQYVQLYAVLNVLTVCVYLWWQYYQLNILNRNVKTAPETLLHWNQCLLQEEAFLTPVLNGNRNYCNYDVKKRHVWAFYSVFGSLSLYERVCLV